MRKFLWMGILALTMFFGGAPSAFATIWSSVEALTKTYSMEYKLEESNFDGTYGAMTIQNIEVTYPAEGAFSDWTYYVVTVSWSGAGSRRHTYGTYEGDAGDALEIVYKVSRDTWDVLSFNTTTKWTHGGTTTTTVNNEAPPIVDNIVYYLSVVPAAGAPEFKITAWKKVKYTFYLVSNGIDDRYDVAARGANSGVNTPYIGIIRNWKMLYRQRPNVLITWELRLSAFTASPGTTKEEKYSAYDIVYEFL